MISRYNFLKILLLLLSSFIRSFAYGQDGVAYDSIYVQKDYRTTLIFADSLIEARIEPSGQYRSNLLTRERKVEVLFDDGGSQGPADLVIRAVADGIVKDLHFIIIPRKTLQTQYRTLDYRTPESINIIKSLPHLSSNYNLSEHSNDAHDDDNSNNKEGLTISEDSLKSACHELIKYFTRRIEALANDNTPVDRERDKRNTRACFLYPDQSKVQTAKKDGTPNLPENLDDYIENVIGYHRKYSKTVITLCDYYSISRLIPTGIKNHYEAICSYQQKFEGVRYVDGVKTVYKDVTNKNVKIYVEIYEDIDVDTGLKCEKFRIFLGDITVGAPKT